MTRPQTQLAVISRPADAPHAGFSSAEALRWMSFRCAIENAVSVVFGIDEGEIRATTRGCARAALARQFAMYLAHVALSLNYTDVGRLFSRDRTTVAHGCAVVEDRRDDPGFDRAMELLEIVARALMAAHDPTRLEAH